jgi:hypothetical protein
MMTLTDPTAAAPGRRRTPLRSGAGALLGLALLPGVLAVPVPAQAQAEGPGSQQEALWEVRTTVYEMLERLVANGTLAREEADALIERAHDEASRKVREATPAPGDVRVTYVPEFVKDEIRQAVVRDLREAVVDDVIDNARDERWGVPGALPSWVDRLSFHGDLRVRAQGVLYDDGNARTTALQTNPYRNVQAINQAGSEAAAGRDAFLNTTVDEYSGRVRLRFGVGAQLSRSWSAGLRFATGNGLSRVSRNYVFGQDEDDDADGEFMVDQAFVRYAAGGTDSPWLLMTGGRMGSPWVGTDLIWDNDLSFDGLALTGRYDFSDTPGKTRSVFLTAAGFSLESYRLETDDKYLYGAQTGLQWTFGDATTFTLAGAWYDYENIVGRRNELESRLTDFTAPQFVQKGNSVFNIRNDTDPTLELLALASDFELVNGTVMLDFGNLFFFGRDVYAPVHLQLVGDWVKNLAFDPEEILARTGVRPPDRDTGYQFGLNFGRPVVRDGGDWRITTHYRHLEGDAVVDGFADSALHLGGTDHEGYGVVFDLGLSRNARMSIEYLTADEIDQAPLAIDILRLDLHAVF